MLTDQHVAHFDTFGYIALRGLFRDEIQVISQAFDDVFADDSHVRLDHEGGTYVTGQRDVIPAIIQKHPVLARLTSDPRIADIADRLLPDGHTLLPGDGSRFRSETTWHVDATAVDMSKRNIKMALYLDRLTTDNGALRVLPGTHRLDDQYTQQVRKAVMHETQIETSIGVGGADVPCWPLESDPGDLLVWDRRILHASYNSTADRRVIAFGFKAT